MSDVTNARGAPPNTPHRAEIVDELLGNDDVAARRAAEEEFRCEIVAFAWCRSVGRRRRRRRRAL